jgi:hypothetical protein
MTKQQPSYFVSLFLSAGDNKSELLSALSGFCRLRLMQKSRRWALSPFPAQRTAVLTYVKMRRTLLLVMFSHDLFLRTRRIAALFIFHRYQATRVPGFTSTGHYT